MHWDQRVIHLRPCARGFHLITDEVVAQVGELREYRVGLAHLFLLHTSASLSLNENADPTVRRDLETHFNTLAPEDAPYYRHTSEGPDDMPAHIKSALLGVSVMIPIRQGEFLLGTWQGIYLCEHRNHGGPRQVAVTLQGEKFA